MAYFGINLAAKDIILENLTINYTNSSRHYHNIQHIHQMLKLSEQFEFSATLQLAIWFHDMIYKALSTRNEIESALYATNKMNQPRPKGTGYLWAII